MPFTLLSLFVVAPEILLPPESTTVTQPADARLTCTASGRPRPTIQWNRAVNQSLIPLVSTADEYDITKAEKGEREISSNLTILGADPFDATAYACNVSNVVNASSAVAVLTVYGNSQHNGARCAVVELSDVQFIWSHMSCSA